MTAATGVRTSSSQGSRAVVILTRGFYIVRFENKDIARFVLAEADNATDFCNGFNEGYMRGRGLRV